MVPAKMDKPRATISSFFDKKFRTPQWLQKKVSRRSALKSAAGATMVAAMPTRAWSALANNKLTFFNWSYIDLF